MRYLTFQPAYSRSGRALHSCEAIRASIGKTIRSIRWDDGELDITFEDDTVLCIWDEGETCVEVRYLHTDDDLTGYGGARLLDLERSTGPDRVKRGTYGIVEVSETDFVHVHTSIGAFTLETHNIHNGYYSGFNLIAEIRAA